MLGLGSGPLAHMLEGGFTTEFLAVLFLLKAILDCTLYRFRHVRRSFFTCSFCGAAAGAIGGRIIAAFGVAGAAPTLAICGMAAVASAVIGAPFLA